MIANRQFRQLANQRATQCAFLLATIVSVVLILTGCVADGGSHLAANGFSAAPVQPRHAAYNCGDDGTITVRAMGRTVHVVDTEGASYDLPASPPTQNSRFGEGNVALVVEEGEALWMKAGREPVTCR